MNNQISDVKVMLAKGIDGEGVESIEKTGTSGLVDTYTITYTDGKKTTFTVTNGKAISTIEKTATVGAVDTYTITYNDGSTDTFTVTNGTVASAIAYDNTESGLQASQVQDAIDELSGDVASVNNRLDAYAFGERVDISAYTSSNKYTAPSDGYLFLGGSSTGSYVTFAIEGKMYLTATQGSAQYNSLYIKKGMQMWDISHGGTYVAYFCPIS